MRRWMHFAARRAIATARSSNNPTLLRRQNQVLSKLIQSGRLHEARQVFDSLPHRNVITWNSMLGGYVRHRELALARRFFDKMPQRDVVSYNSMLSGYALSRDGGELKEGRCLFDQMPLKDTVSWNTMISGYARNGRMDEAIHLFDTMPEKNVISWNTMITGFLGVGDVRRATELFERMPVRDAASLNALVSGLIRNDMLEEAEIILLQSRTINKIEGAVDAYNTMIAGYGQRGKVEKARRLFDLIPCQHYQERKGSEEIKKTHPYQKYFKRNVVSWNSMIMCYVKAGDLCSARALFDEMPERDLFSWNTMITGYVQAQEMEEAQSLFQGLLDPDARSWNLMICGFTQKGEVEQAQEFFDRMPQKSIVSWNTMIAGYEQNGDYEGAIELFSKMQVVGEKPDWHTLSSVLSACAGLAILHLGTQIHQLITKTIVADIPINNALITMYARCGNLMDAKAIFDGMKMQRDVVSWNAMIGGYAQHGLASKALALFEDMKRRKIRPTHITFTAMLNACGHAGLVDEGRREFDSMVHEFDIVPRVEHYASLVDLIGRHGQLEDAMEVINSMTVPPDKAVWGALLGACRVHNNVELAWVAAKALAEVEPESSAPYVLLYNIHADKGRWDDAIKLREMMDKYRVLKLPGYSWIEMCGNVHIFVSGDRSHPLSNHIYSLLESSNRIIRDLQLD
ncbi:pentatricopeptide repeat-containing protein, mitochondrial [Cocos nucifera]|uniref:Pentatricopeptide repeat-containing protein, mitochondrial n=1 Tax=Cocos nucifera TaxID=13894 RepID=A0A8K0I331_COCNU|nr:pentatricopeptide repeat-containing protein, mitochondrial [Cocos nucifera]